jgi:AcrR family transcriptional regulator
MTAASSTRRSDAQRNRERILCAAKAAFADADADVSMVEIARRAGVGSATLYRNFARRRDLLEALYVGEIDAICRLAGTVEGDTAGARLTCWLRQFYAYFTSKRAVAAELLTQTDADSPVFGAGLARVLTASRPLLVAAQASGDVRRDLTLEQVLDLIAAVATIPRSSDYREPLLQAALDGLQVRHTGP